MILVAFLMLFTIDNKEFFDTVEKQRADGYKWQSIECREADKKLPSITIKTHTGKEIICNKLVKD